MMRAVKRDINQLFDRRTSGTEQRSYREGDMLGI
jgi:hypothetical protein